MTAKTPPNLDEVCEAMQQGAAEIERLRAALAQANSQAEHFEREWYLRGDELERLRSVAESADHDLEKARVWNGTEWHYNPLHPMFYKPAIDRLREVLSKKP